MDDSLTVDLAQLRRHDPALSDRLNTAFERLLRAADALAWSRDRLPRLVAAGAPALVLDVLADEAAKQTGAPEVWALQFTGDPTRGSVGFRAMAARSSRGAPEGDVAPEGLSKSIVGRAMREGRPAWSDDAMSDSRFASAESVQAFDLRSVGCVPIGKTGALYLYDPTTPGKFTPEARARLAALCALAAPFLDRPAGAKRSQPVAIVPGLVGETPAMDELFAAVRAFAPMPWPALVLGETGTGKEAVARALHVLSPRGSLPFVPVNCGAIPDELAESTLFGHERGSFTGAEKRKEGLVERVHGGTLFLDEVGELSGRAQVKLLRLLQEGTYERVGGERELRFEGRILAATNRPVDDAARRDVFREDLYHRLSACVLHVPPLRDRLGDVPVLVDYLLATALAEVPGAPALQVDPDAVRFLQTRDWPGNVRELGNAVRGAIARALARQSPSVGVEDFGGRRPSTSPSESPVDLEGATDAFQRQRVYAAIAAAAGGNKSKAAEALGVSRQWLHRLLSRWEAEK